jgi:hypothetical protein
MTKELVKHILGVLERAFPELIGMCNSNCVEKDPP